MRPSRTKRSGLCEAHYYRQRRTGDVQADRPLVLGDQGCAIEGCDGKHAALGWCSKHYQRWRDTGDPSVRRPMPSGPHHPQWAGDEIGYSGAHQRVSRIRGPASAHTCPCGSPARQWAYLTSSSALMPYSPDPADYSALCIPCHKRFDLERLRACL